MHAERHFDDSLSGTTSISLLLRGRTMFISNVGDSRAILVSLKVSFKRKFSTCVAAVCVNVLLFVSLGVIWTDIFAFRVSNKKDGRLVAKPLSNDQTPYRKDERDRIKKTGARVLSMDQIEGIEPVQENWGDLNLGKIFSPTHFLSCLSLFETR